MHRGVSNVPVLLSGGGGPSLPVAGAVLWLRADQVVGVANGGAVATWPDLSGGGHDATQATSGARPTYVASGLNSLPAIAFNGSQGLSIADHASLRPTRIAVAIVYRVPTHQSFGKLLSRPYLGSGAWADPYVSWALSGSTGTTRPYLELTTATNAFALGDPNLDTPQCVVGIYDGTNIVIRQNGAQTGSQAKTGNLSYAGDAAAGVHIAMRRSDVQDTMIATISEIVVYGSALNSTDRGLLETYLMGRYGL